jgi:hypothetical protein
MMRYILIAATSLIVSACALAPQEPTSTPARNEPIRPSGSVHGISENDLVVRFGQPRLRVKEGDGTKLQWSANGCVLDAYLYPSRSNAQSLVTHVDTRSPSGGTVALNACLALLAR